MKLLAAFAWSVACFSLSVFCAYWLVEAILAIPGNMPYWVDMTLRFGFRLLVQEDNPDPDDMGTCAVILYFLFSLAVSGTLFSIVGKRIWKHYAAPHFRA